MKRISNLAITFCAVAFAFLLLPSCRTQSQVFKDCIEESVENSGYTLKDTVLVLPKYEQNSAMISHKDYVLVNGSVRLNFSIIEFDTLVNTLEFDNETIYFMGRQLYESYGNMIIYCSVSYLHREWYDPMAEFIEKTMEEVRACHLKWLKRQPY
jgi:hypothetical protein